MNHTYLAYNLIKPGDNVLDVGGASQPFHRANSVIDAIPYEQRNKSNSFLRGLPESFSKETWFVQDICDHTKRFPFKDKEFDFVICGQVLEDVRDPLYVVHEMQRVAKRGIIETPSRFYEQLSGLEHKDLAGSSHHRWFVSLRMDPVSRQKELVFTFKNHRVHAFDQYRLSPPFKYRNTRYPYLNPLYQTFTMIWDEDFKVLEDVPEAISGCEKFMKETKQLADALGDELWDQSQNCPSEISSPFNIGGVFDVWEIKKRWKTPIPIYDPLRRRTRTSLEYEMKLTGNPLHPDDARGLERLEMPLYRRAIDKFKRTVLKKETV